MNNRALVLGCVAGSILPIVVWNWVSFRIWFDGTAHLPLSEFTTPYFLIAAGWTAFLVYCLLRMRPYKSRYFLLLLVLPAYWPTLLGVLFYVGIRMPGKG